MNSFTSSTDHTNFTPTMVSMLKCLLGVTASDNLQDWRTTSYMSLITEPIALASLNFFRRASEHVHARVIHKERMLQAKLRKASKTSKARRRKSKQGKQSKTSKQSKTKQSKAIQGKPS